MDRTIIEQIATQLNLGTLVAVPRSLTGGFLHKMYSLHTTKGRYAVKLLNPHIMKRETAPANYRCAEELEQKLEEQGLPILPALSFGGRKMQEINGQFFYLYDWYDGKALKSSEVTADHCTKIGRILAAIHGIERRPAEDMGIERRPEEDMSREQRPEENVDTEPGIDWDFYIDQMAAANLELHSLLFQTRPILYECVRKGNQAVKRLPAVETICHNDMDCKNVLWNRNECRVIDLECLSWSNPYVELYETALCWSGYETNAIDFHRLKQFMDSYSEAGGKLPAECEVVYDSNVGRLGWLEYNLKRVLGIDCGADEKEMGISQVRSSIAQIMYYHDAKEDILHCLNEA